MDIPVQNEQANVDANPIKQDTTITASPAPTPTKKKSLLQKIRQALQDWSNGDKQQQEFDDTQV